MSVLDRFVIVAVAKVALRIPTLAVILMPAAALIGALLGLGDLAVHRELVVMRCSGVSLARLMGAIAAAGGVLMLVMALLGESLAPSMSVYARDLRARALLETEALSGESSTRQIAGFSTISLKPCSTGPMA